MKKKDILLIIVFLSAAAIMWIFVNRPHGDAGEGEAVIYKNGEVFDTVSLSEEKTVVIEDGNGNRNVIRIEGGQVKMIEASCPDQLCVNTRPAKRNGESIICLPNRVAVEIRSTVKSDIDGVSE